NIDELLELCHQSDATHEYTVSWVDTTASGKHIGRGIFMRGNHAETTTQDTNDIYKKPLATMPVTMPDWFINTPLIKTFNIAYYHKQLAKRAKTQTHYNPFFYPLDIL